MCKLFIATGSMKRENALLALDKANTAFKWNQRDGFGFLAAGAESLAWGRYENPSSFPAFHSGLIDQITGPKIEIGEIPRKINTLMIHGRTSTNVKGVNHCHPFEDRGLYLIHNGVLDSVGTSKSEKLCDSEEFLEWFANGGGLDNLNKSWSGYGAIFIFNENTGERILIKDDTTRLYVAKRKFDGFVFSTSDDDLKDICKEGQINLTSKAVPLPKCIITFDAKGNIDSFKDWEGFGKRVYDSLACSSMGYVSQNKCGTPYYNGLNSSPQLQGASKTEAEIHEIWDNLV